MERNLFNFFYFCLLPGGIVIYPNPKLVQSGAPRGDRQLCSTGNYSTNVPCSPVVVLCHSMLLHEALPDSIPSLSILVSVVLCHNALPHCTLLLLVLGIHLVALLVRTGALTIWLSYCFRADLLCFIIGIHL